jgi:hypothetical protein
MYTRSHKSSHPEAGNILIYILGAIFLLGLLVVISKGSVTPGAGIDQETLLLRVAEVQNYGKELERAVSYVMANGHSEVDIRFAHPDAASAYGDITNIPSRQIFSRDGGGATYRKPPQGVQTTPTDWNFTGENFINQIGTTCSSSLCTDLIAILKNVSKDFCLLINNKNGITNPSNNPPTDAGNALTSNLFSGDFSFNSAINDISTDLDNRSEACFEGSNDPPAGTYHYYRVLLAR